MAVTLVDLIYDEQAGHLTRKDVAARYGVTMPTIRNWVLCGLLPEPHGVRATTRELLWDAARLPDPATLQRPKPPGRPVGSVCRRPATPYHEPDDRVRKVG